MQQSTAGLGLGVTPIGPTWDLHHYFLGADEQGRDVAARLLYGGRNSLLIGTSRALITCLLAVLIGVVAGFFGGLVDGVLSRAARRRLGLPRLPARDQPLDRADRAGLLGRAAATRVGQPPAADRDHRARLHPVRRPADSRRSASIRRREFVEAAIGLGASNWRLLWSEVLRTSITLAIVLFPLMLAIDMLTEAALSFLSIGVQAPNASWGTIVLDGKTCSTRAPQSRSTPGSRSRHRAGAERARRRHPGRARPRAKLRGLEVKLGSLARRLVSMVFVRFSISVLSFLIFFATPGVDPAARIAGRNADQGTLNAVGRLGLDRPLPVRYGLMMKSSSSRET